MYIILSIFSYPFVLLTAFTSSAICDHTFSFFLFVTWLVCFDSNTPLWLSMPSSIACRAHCSNRDRLFAFTTFWPFWVLDLAWGMVRLYTTISMDDCWNVKVTMIHSINSKSKPLKCCGTNLLQSRRENSASVRHTLYSHSLMHTHITQTKHQKIKPNHRHT